MKKRVSRLLAFIMVLSLLLTPAQAAQRNSAVRHKTSAALSSAAQSYYTGSFSLDRLLAMSGNTLYDSLGALMSGTITKTYSYSSLPGYWSRTDAAQGLDDAVYFYSDVSCKVGGTFSREHVWPKSHGTFYQTGAGSDLHHLRPEANEVNTVRNNYTFGNVRGVLWGYKTKSFGGKEVLWYNGDYTGSGCDGIVEVADNVKGDVARILLYVYTTYDQPNLFTNTGSTGSGYDDSDGKKVIESLDTLLSWCQTDPVDEWEMQRNDLVQQLQGNRNVFIDYPELAWLMFGRKIPVMTTPSGYAANQTGYRDVRADAWYADGVDYVTKKGYMQGIGNNCFAPEQSLTRAQLVTILYRMERSPYVIGRSGFSDVKNGTWYSDAIAWAASKGIVKGFSSTIFGPDQPVTREQLVTILYRYSGASPGSRSAIRSFPDRGEVSDFALDAVCWAVEQGIISGVSRNGKSYLSPKTGATRAQFAVILLRWK